MMQGSPVFFAPSSGSMNEPIYFFSRGTRAPMELTVNQVGKDKIAGYLSVPKSASNTHAQASGN